MGNKLGGQIGLGLAKFLESFVGAQARGYRQAGEQKRQDRYYTRQAERDKISDERYAAEQKAKRLAKTEKQTLALDELMQEQDLKSKAEARKREYPLITAQEEMGKKGMGLPSLMRTRTGGRGEGMTQAGFLEQQLKDLDPRIAQMLLAGGGAPGGGPDISVIDAGPSGGAADLGDLQGDQRQIAQMLEMLKRAGEYGYEDQPMPGMGPEMAPMGPELPPEMQALAGDLGMPQQPQAPNVFNDRMDALSLAKQAGGAMPGAGPKDIQDASKLLYASGVIDDPTSYTPEAAMHAELLARDLVGSEVSTETLLQMGGPTYGAPRAQQGAFELPDAPEDSRFPVQAAASQMDAMSPAFKLDERESGGAMSGLDMMQKVMAVRGGNVQDPLQFSGRIPPEGVPGSTGVPPDIMDIIQGNQDAALDQAMGGLAGLRQEEQQLTDQMTQSPEELEQLMEVLKVMTARRGEQQRAANREEFMGAGHDKWKKEQLENTLKQLLGGLK